MPELTGSNRNKLLSTVQNTDLRKIVDQLYRPGATVGDGGTASNTSARVLRGLFNTFNKSTRKTKSVE
jgi:cyanophycinase-like exopeptidase